MPVQSRKPRQDALQTLYPDDPTTESTDSITVKPGEEPLSDELFELAAVMCEMDLLSIDIIILADQNSGFMSPGTRDWMKKVITPMFSDQKLERENDFLLHVRRENWKGSNLFSKGYLSNSSVLRYLEAAANLAYRCQQSGWPHGMQAKDFPSVTDLAKEFCILSIRAAGETDLNDDVLTTMKNRLVQLERLTVWTAGPRRMKSWRTMMPQIQKAREKRISTTVINSQRDSDRTSTLVAITGITIILAMIPTYMAWTRSPYSPGSTADSDFWWLIQSSVMALLSLLTLSIPIYEDSKFSHKGRTWFWTCWFISAATVATILAPVLYVLVPTAYSGATVFVGSACQAFVVLQLSLAASIGMGRAKEKEKTS